MKLTLTDLMDNLASELSHLSLFQINEENGVPFDQFNKRILPFLNSGLTDIHTRFFVKEKEIWVKHCPNDRRLILDRKHARTAHRLRGDAFIDDCGDSFRDDVVEILSIYDEHGHEYPLNVNTGRAEPKAVGGACGHGPVGAPNSWERYQSTMDKPCAITTLNPYGHRVDGHHHHELPVLFTPAMNVIRIPDRMRQGYMRVRYKASPARVAKLEDDGITSYDDVKIDLPFTYLNALVFFIAARLTAGVTGGIQGQVNQTNDSTTYYNQYISQCQMLSDQGIDIEQVGSSETRFNRSGFI